jgi:hypothetical protein
MTHGSERPLAGTGPDRHNFAVHALTLILLLAGCPEEVVEAPPVADPTLPSPSGESRAALVAAGQEAAFFGGIGAEGQVGDVKIFNENVQFVISAVGRRHGWIDVGGTVVDADLVRPAGTVGRDGLDDAFLSFGVSRMFEAETVEVLNDGLDGAAAVVRTSGRDVAWDFFSNGIETPPLIPDLGLLMDRTYTLEPGAWAVRVDTSFRNSGGAAVSALPAEGFMASKEDFATWYAGKGLVDEASGEVGASGYWGTHNEGVFALWGEEPLRVSSATSLLSIASVRLFNHERVELEPGDTTTRTVFYGLGPDTAFLEARRRSGETLTSVSGVVSDPAGPVAGARVHFERDDEVYGFAVTGDDGSYLAELPPGDWRAWVTAELPFHRVDVQRGAGRFGHLSTPALQQEQLSAVTGPSTVPMASGRAPLGPVALTLGADAVDRDFELGAQGLVELTVTRDGVPSSAVVDILDLQAIAPDGGPVPEDLREAFGLRDWSIRVGRAFTADGSMTLPLAPGRTYSIDVSRSWKDGRKLNVAELGDTNLVTLDVDLDQQVPDDGWVSVDTHLHAAPSMDGRTAMEDRLIACAAAGLDVPVTTDHDRFADYRPLATALGLDDQMTVLPGTEVTAVVRGHWNLFPVEPVGQGARNGGALVWWDRALTDTDSLMERIREVGADDALVQVNHGRLALGMMDASGYSVATGEPANERLWTWDFDAVEIITADDIDDWRSNRDDWFSFLQHGRLRVPTGSSDSHDLGRACALGRTDVQVRTADWTLDDVVEGLRAGSVVVAAGVTLRADVQGAPPGSTLSGGAHNLAVQVSGPNWMRPGTLRVWQNYDVVFEQALPEPSVDGVFFDDIVPIVATDDAWVVVEVDDGLAQGWWQGGHPPYALTNAFLVDVAGDGWTAPAAD